MSEDLDWGCLWVQAGLARYCPRVGADPGWDFPWMQMRLVQCCSMVGVDFGWGCFWALVGVTYHCPRVGWGYPWVPMGLSVTYPMLPQSQRQHSYQFQMGPAQACPQTQLGLAPG